MGTLEDNKTLSQHIKLSTEEIIGPWVWGSLICVLLKFHNSKKKKEIFTSNLHKTTALILAFEVNISSINLDLGEIIKINKFGGKVRRVPIRELRKM